MLAAETRSAYSHYTHAPSAHIEWLRRLPFRCAIRTGKTLLSGASRRLAAACQALVQHSPLPGSDVPDWQLNRHHASSSASLAHRDSVPYAYAHIYGGRSTYGTLHATVLRCAAILLSSYSHYQNNLQSPSSSFYSFIPLLAVAGGCESVDLSIKWKDVALAKELETKASHPPATARWY